MIYCTPCTYHPLEPKIVRVFTLDDILNIGSEYFRTSENALKSKCRKRIYTEVRQMIMYAMFYKGFKDGKVGEKFNRDRTTVMHSRNVVMSLCFSDKNYKTRFNEFLSLLE